MTVAAQSSVEAGNTARERIRSAPIVIDMVYPYDPELGNGTLTLQRFKTSGFHFVQGHPAGEHSTGEAVHRIARMRAELLAQPDQFILVEQTSDMLRARAEDKIGVGIQLEGFGCLEGSIEMVEVFHALGVRLCHPIWNIPNALGGGCAEGSHEIGLTRFGRRVVEAMNSVGMIVDGSHAGYRVQRDMLELSSAPVVFTHHGAHALRPHVRNLPDDIIDLCAERGGVVGITGGAFYLGGEPTAELLFRHLDHVVQRVGPRHVGLGTDYILDTDDMARFIMAYPDKFPGLDDGAWEPVAFAPPEILPELVELMVDAGYDQSATNAILGGNWLRICDEVWK